MIQHQFIGTSAIPAMVLTLMSPSDVYAQVFCLSTEFILKSSDSIAMVFASTYNFALLRQIHSGRYANECFNSIWYSNWLIWSHPLNPTDPRWNKIPSLHTVSASYLDLFTTLLEEGWSSSIFPHISFVDVLNIYWSLDCKISPGKCLPTGWTSQLKYERW